MQRLQTGCAREDSCPAATICILCKRSSCRDAQELQRAQSLAAVRQAQARFLQQAAGAAFDASLDPAAALMAPALRGLLAACKRLCVQWARSQVRPSGCWQR